MYDALKAGDKNARWNFKGMHPGYKGKSLRDVDAASLSLADVQLVVAQEYAFNKGEDLAKFADAVTRDSPITTFETAVDMAPASSDRPSASARSGASRSNHPRANAALPGLSRVDSGARNRA